MKFISGKILSLFLVLLMIVSLAGLSGCSEIEVTVRPDVPQYSGQTFTEINNNQPYFTSDEMVTVSFETYGELDSLGRCTEAYACIGEDLMPDGERGEIGYIKPTGWQTVKYDIVDGKYLYNRCHLIGWQLTGENANERNLITGTRYMNVDGMLDFENAVDDYIETTGNHVLYRVTPIFEGDNLLASGVTMEAYSVEDKGKGICFNVYVYNIQPGIEIDYTNGDSWLAGESSTESATASTTAHTVSAGEYVLNKNSKKIHLSTCGSVKQMSEGNKAFHKGSLESLMENGYVHCKTCIDSLNEYMIETESKIVHSADCIETGKSTEKYVGVLEILTGDGYIICDKCKVER